VSAPARPVAETLREFTAQYLNVPLAEVDLDMLVADVQDSLTLSEILVAMEDTYHVQLEENAVGRLRVLRDLVPLVEEKLAQK
jgi:acyl carrier protein